MSRSTWTVSLSLLILLGYADRKWLDCPCLSSEYTTSLNSYLFTPQEPRNRPGRVDEDKLGRREHSVQERNAWGQSWTHRARASRRQRRRSGLPVPIRPAPDQHAEPAVGRSTATGHVLGGPAGTVEWAVRWAGAASSPTTAAAGGTVGQLPGTETAAEPASGETVDRRDGDQLVW